MALARSLAKVLRPCDIWAPEEIGLDGARPYRSATAALRQLFVEGRPILALCACGIVIRALAPVLAQKEREPPVLAVAEDGSAVVPLLGGHHGANALALEVGAALGIAPAITTASDVRFGIGLDDLPRGWGRADPQVHKRFTARLLGGARARLTVDSGDVGWLRRATLPLAPDGTLELRVTHKALPEDPDRLVLHPPVLALGVGCERDVPAGDLVDHARRVLAEAGLAAGAVACVASVDLKVDEPAVHALAASLGVPARFFTATELNRQEDRLTVRSAAAFAATGAWGVAESAALAAAGPSGTLAVPKRIGPRVTCAVALAPAGIDAVAVGRARGRLTLVGLGPGAPAMRTREAEAAILGAEHVVGYRLYLDLAGDLLDDRTRHDFALGEEEARCRKALDLAALGQQVALLASGDPGIYAMASPVLELIDREGRAEWRRIELRVIPGVSAMQAAAARAGAPLGHDFCVISLSDLLTPWPGIERRLEAAAAADLVVALYNPVSARRQAALGRAKAILLAQRAPDTPVVVAAELGRAGERVAVTTLDALDVRQVDMLTTVLVGSSTTRRLDLGHGREVAYTPRGYRLP